MPFRLPPLLLQFLHPPAGILILLLLLLLEPYLHLTLLSLPQLSLPTNILPLISNTKLATSGNQRQVLRRLPASQPSELLLGSLLPLIDTQWSN